MPTTCVRSGLLAIIVGFLLLGCKQAQKNNSSEDLIDQIAIEKVGSNFDPYTSPDKSYVLFIEKINPTAANPITKFIVIESVSKKIMIEKSFRSGYVKWIGDSVIELLDAPATLKQNEDLSYYIKKIDIASYKN